MTAQQLQAQISQTQADIADLEQDLSTLRARLDAEITAYTAARASRDIGLATQSQGVVAAVKETIVDIEAQLKEAQTSLPKLEGQLARETLLEEAAQLVKTCASEGAEFASRTLAIQAVLEPLEADLLRGWWAWFTAHGRFQRVAASLGLKPSELVDLLASKGLPADSARVRFYFGQAAEDRFQIPHTWPETARQPVRTLAVEIIRAGRSTKVV